MPDDDGSTFTRFAEREFKLPSASQAGSNLLQLPVELHLKILRNLMYSTDAIEPFDNERENDKDSEVWSDHEFEVWIDNGPELSTQLLRCCQQLFRAGVYILYEQNTLVVRCRQNRTPCLYALDGAIAVSYWVAEIHKQPRSISWYVDNAEKYSDDCNYTMGHQDSSTYWSHFEKNVPAVLNFSSLIINPDPLYADDSTSYFVVCRVLADLVRGKPVIVELNSDLKKEQQALFLLACRYWSCKTLGVRHSTLEHVQECLDLGLGVKRTYDTLQVFNAVDDLDFVHWNSHNFYPRFRLYKLPLFTEDFLTAVCTYNYRGSMEAAQPVIHHLRELITKVDSNQNEAVAQAQELCERVKAEQYPMMARVERFERRLAKNVRRRDQVREACLEALEKIQEVEDKLRGYMEIFESDGRNEVDMSCLSQYTKNVPKIEGQL